MSVKVVLVKAMQVVEIGSLKRCHRGWRDLRVVLTLLQVARKKVRLDVSRWIAVWGS